MNENQSSPDTSDRLRSILVLVATLGMIAFNALAAAGRVNGVSPAEISNKYPTILTPAGYAFSIWSLIYLGLIGFSIYQMLPANLGRLRRIRSLYILSCVLNCAWIYVWHYGQIALSLVVILLLWGTLLVIAINLSGRRSTGETWLMQAPFGIYFGWVTAASIVNFFILLAYLNVDPGERTMLFIGSAAIFIAALAAVIVRLKLTNFFYPLAVAWALTAIAVKQSGQTAIVVSAAVGVVVCLITTGSLVTKLKDSTSE
jgi:hypothetical protein